MPFRLVVCLIVLSSTTALAQQQSPQLPPRDPAAAPAREATAVIRGRVLAADTGRPLRRARITVELLQQQQERNRQTTSTGVDGRFEISGLQPGRYRVSVTRGGYLQLEYGQRRPGEQGRPVQIEEGQAVGNVDFTMPRMSVISGRVTDEFGDPIEGVTVFGMRSLFFDGQRRFVPVNLNTTTDDVGEYRIPRLPPGTYAVMASTRETWVVTEGGTLTTFGYLPTYFPGVANGAEARRVTLGVGQSVTGIDFSLVPGRAPTVSGLAVDSRGRPFPRVTLRDEVRGLDFGSFRGGPDAAVNADGTFVIRNVPPATYVLTASRMPGDAQGDPEVAELPIVVETTDIDNIMLVGSSGGVVTGRVLSEGAKPPRMSAVRIAVLEPTRGQPSPTRLGAFRSPAGFAAATASDDGTFTVQNVIGRARFQVTVPDGWMVKRIEHQGRDISDAPIELRSGEEMAGVEVVITDRVTSVSGQLVDAKGQPIRDATVLVFPSDRERWFESSRRMRAVRPDQRGQWEIRGLPAGDYLAVALDYVDSAGWIDPDFLDSLRDYGRPLTIGDGTSQSLQLTVTEPKGR